MTHHQHAIHAGDLRRWTLVMVREGTTQIVRVQARTERDALSKVPRSMDDWACTEAR